MQGAAPVGWTVERHDTVTSTMDVARQRARMGAPDGTVVVADEMTHGRGTHGRVWHAPKGGLYLSVVLRGLRGPHLLTLALGNAVANALEVAGVEPRLKWVNDVLIPDRSGAAGGRKVAGILVEAESTGDKLDFLVAGIGINANGAADAFPAAIKGQATTLEAELGCDTCIPDLEALLLHELGKAVAQVREGRGSEIVAAFRARDALAGQAIVLEDGARTVRGIAKGIDDGGRLLVQADGTAGTTAFATGSVRLKPDAAGQRRS